MKFTALDFETANRKRGSVCQVGIAVFEDNSIVDSNSWLVKPYNEYFDDINIHIHGIDQQTVASAPYFDEVWHEVKQYLDDTLLVAHNASFDISVLRHALDNHSITYPTFDYLCSYRLAQHIWDDLLSYKLSYLANTFDFDLNHHDALSDAVAAGKILLRCMDDLSVNDFNEFQKELRLKTGSVFERGYKTPRINCVVEENINVQIINDLEVDNPFRNKTVVFTGALGFLTRKKAKQLVKAFGGTTKTTVSKKVDMLVVGETDIKKYGEGYKTNKLEKAEKLRSNGHQIELFSEDEFLNFCQWAEGQKAISSDDKSRNSKSKETQQLHQVDLYALKINGVDVRDDFDQQKAQKLIQKFKDNPSSYKKINEIYSNELFLLDLFEYAMENMKDYDIKRINYNNIFEVGLNLLKSDHNKEDILSDLDLFFDAFRERNQIKLKD